MKYKITKIENLREVVNGMVGAQWYFLAYCRVYPENTEDEFWRRRFVFMFDGDDIAEYYAEEDSDDYPVITDEMINEYKNEIVWSFAESYIGSNNNISDVTSECDNTIDRYNDLYAARDLAWENRFCI